MKTFHALVLAGALVGTGLALAVGIVRSDAIAPSFFGPKAETTIAQPTVAPIPIAQSESTAAPVGTIPPITTTSSASAIALAKHLKSVGVKMYGAYWCPHCHEQLQVFGQKAAAQLPYIECAEDGKNSRPDLCKTAKIEGYPTWKIKGKTYMGIQSLEELATASGYKGSRKF
jgi:protein-disulfide isomerase